MTTRHEQTAASTPGSTTIDETHTQRRQLNWCQTESTKLDGVEDAPKLIDRLGIVTLFPVSPEIPNLFHAYMGDPEAVVDSGHDSPSGQVYSWRWTLGGQGVAFYGAIVRNRPTWVSWSLLPAILRLRAELRAAGDLYQAGALSNGALRIAEALQAADGELSTGDLRREAGFPTGKENRAAYLKALDELDRRLLVAKVFLPGSTDMRHALVSARYPEQQAAAQHLTQETALAKLLDTYLPHAVYVVPTTLARHLGLEEPRLRSALDALRAAGKLSTATFAGTKGTCYAWQTS